MKKMLHIVRSSLHRIVAYARGSSVHMRALSILAVCALIAVAYLYAARRSDDVFDAEYAAYAGLAAQADNAAYIPGAQSDPVRAALDQDLTEVLDQTLSASQRLAFANKGLADLKDSESQINDISSTTAKVDAQIAKMQVDMLESAAASDKAYAILALAKKRSSTISDIRAYSYRADFEISQIFTHIVAAQGQLTQEYIVELNDEIPDVGTEFDKRTALYGQLQSISSQIADTYSGSGTASAGGSGQ